MIVIPAVDILGGRCVRLLQGRREAETVYYDDPVDAARRWAEEGATLIHVVDLDGAFEGHPVNLLSIKRILESVDVPIEVGGGIRSPRSAQELIRMGVAQVVVGTAAVTDPMLLERLCSDFPGRVALAVDARDGSVTVKGWEETTDIKVIELIERLATMPISCLIYTDVKRDGTMKGPNLEAIAEVATMSPFPLVASGGVSSLEDLHRLAELEVVAGVIVGKALLEGAFSLKEAMEAVA